MSYFTFTFVCTINAEMLQSINQVQSSTAQKIPCYSVVGYVLPNISLSQVVRDEGREACICILSICISLWQLMDQTMHWLRK